MEGRRGRPPHPGDVTPAEARVLELVQQGLPNAEIAVRLGISINTVRYHVSNLLAKSGASERGELRDWRPPRGAGGWGIFGYLTWFAKPAVAAAAVASIAVVAIAGLAVRPEADSVFDTGEEQSGTQPMAVVGEMRRNGAELTLIEKGTGRAYPVRDELNMGRNAGQLVFLLGELEGGEIRPTAGSVVGPLSQCSGVLSGTEDGYFIEGGSCDGVEIVDVSLTRLLALRAESVTVTVLPCTLTRDGRLVNPHMTLAGEGGQPSC
ncbi:MAG: LuxR C-terminal-related transcriptional regulator [Tepidiformaceae bacterium]